MIFETTDEQLILIADGTYCYIQKSSNNYFQKHSYSGQKKRHLVKPFIICCTNGRIVDIKGLYGANENDATILYNLLKKCDDLKEILEPGDQFILDRGFDDATKSLEEFGYGANIPAFIEGDKKQLSTIDANRSRLVTKCRWPVEVINAFLKVSFKALRNVPNRSLPHTNQDYRIAGALINKFFARFLLSDFDKQVEIATRMKAKFNELKVNPVQTIVEDNELHKKSQFNKMEDAAAITDFPRLSIEEIEKITDGRYQLFQAWSYIADHKRANGKFEIMICKECSVFGDLKMVFAKIQSRHIKRTQYRTYVMYTPSSTSEVQTAMKVHGCYCTCKNGARTVGCCSHSACIIYYLSHGMYMEYQKNPAPNMYGVTEGTQDSIPKVAYIVELF